MTLKEKLADAILVPLYNQGFYIDWDKVDKCEKIADDYAIEFAKWLRYNCVETDYGWQNHGKQYSDEEILKLFKKEKGYDTTTL